MFGCTLLAGYGVWCVFPLIMIAMIFFCFLIMRSLGMGRWIRCYPRNRRPLSDEVDPSSK